MICTSCGNNEACIHVTSVAMSGEGEVRKADLCNPCAEKWNVNDPAGFSFDELIAAGVMRVDRQIHAHLKGMRPLAFAAAVLVSGKPKAPEDWSI